MTRAFLFLWRRTFKNRLLAQARRLRRPRYLISAVIGVAYFYGLAGRYWIKGIRHMAAESPAFAVPPELLEMIGAIFVLGSVLVAWCGPTPVSPLAYTEAEIQHLFPAPITRRGLVRWKVLKGQIGVLVSVLIFTVIAAPRIARGGRTIFLVGAWIAFATMQLHLIGIRMALHGLKRRGLAWGLRASIAVLVSSLAVACAGYWAFRVVGPPPAMTGEGVRQLDLFADYLGRILGTGPAWLLTWPGRLLVRPMLAPHITGFLLSLPAALALLVLNHLWVMRSGVALEEGAVEAARHLAETKSAMGQGRLRRARRIRVTKPPFTLTPMGHPEIALLWKNLIAAFRTVGGARSLALVVGGTLGLSALILNLTRQTELAAVIGAMCAMLAGILLMVGPALIRCDFRQDLQHIDLLKSYPLSGLSLLVGSLLTPIIILTVVEWMLLAAFAAIVPVAAGLENLTWSGGPAVLALTGAILAPSMIATATLIQNAGFLIVPGWVALGAGRTTGVERIGQGLLTSIGQITAMAVGFIPAALVFGVSWFVGSGFMGSVIALPLSAFLAALVLAAECFIGALLLGAWLDRLDPSREFDTLARQE